MRLKIKHLVFGIVFMLSAFLWGVEMVNAQSLTEEVPAWIVGTSDSLMFGIENTDNTEVSATYFNFSYDPNVMTIDNVVPNVDEWLLVYKNDTPGVLEIALLSQKYRAFDGPFFSVVATPQTSGDTGFTLSDVSWVDCRNIILIPPDTTTRPVDPTPEQVAALYPGQTYWIDALRGVDTNPCTSWDEPCRSVEPFKNALNGGDAVVFTEGTHRTYVELTRSGNPDNPITYTGYPDREVVLSGADLWNTSWSNNGNGTWTMPYTQALPEHPIVGEPDQDQYRPEVLVVNGTFYGTVYDANDVVGGTFFVDGPSSGPSWMTANFNGLDPNMETIEIGTRPQIFEGTVDYIRVENLTFRHGPSSFGHKGCLQVTGQFWVVNDVLVEYCNNNGIRIEGSGHALIDVWSNFNGMMGIHTFAADFVNHIRGGVIGNNTKQFLHDWHAGGHKVTHGASNGLWDGFQALGNEGPGLWFDIPWNEHNVVRNSFFMGNSMAGVMLEHGTVYTKVHNNVIYGTRKYNGVGPGFRVQAASDNIIEYNIVYGNHGNGVRENFTDKRSPTGHNWWNANIFTHNGVSSDDREFRIIRESNEKIVDHFSNNIWVDRPGFSTWAADNTLMGLGTDDLTLWLRHNLHSLSSDTLYDINTQVIEDPTSGEGWRPVIDGNYGPQE